jgi:uncharacterized repeat protein (TIGR03803 family)
VCADECVEGPNAGAADRKHRPHRAVRHRCRSVERSDLQRTAGNLYGTASWGGTAGQGLVYELDTAGHETVLHNFTGGADGGYPYAGVIRDAAGNLYGTTEYGGLRSTGVIFKITP